MSWERDPLWAKARLFFERAFDESQDEPVFGLWCSLGLELLARAALASISPTLLAKPDREHKYLLHALNRGSERVPRISLDAVQVFGLCLALFAKFTEDDYKASLALVNRRNEELHSGHAAFDEYPSSQWLAVFYRACASLSSSMGESLVSLFGEDNAAVATEILKENMNDVKQRVMSTIASHKTVFQEISKEDKEKAKVEAEELGKELSTQQHHCVSCPACKCVATVQGRAFGKQHVSYGDDEIIVKQTVIPGSFSCSACGLKLVGYTQLEMAGLGGHYQRKTTHSPEEFFGLIHPDDIYDYLGSMEAEYDNE